MKSLDSFISNKRERWRLKEGKEGIKFQNYQPQTSNFDTFLIYMVKPSRTLGKTKKLFPIKLGPIKT